MIRAIWKEIFYFHCVLVFNNNIDKAEKKMIEMGFEPRFFGDPLQPCVVQVDTQDRYSWNEFLASLVLKMCDVISNKNVKRTVKSLSLLF